MIQLSLDLLLYTALLYLFISLSSLPVPSSFSAVTSSEQLLSVALSRTKPGFVYMVTERRDGWGWRRRAGENDRHARAARHHIGFVCFQGRFSWIPVHVTVIRNRKTDCSLATVCVCVLMGGCRSILLCRQVNHLTNMNNFLVASIC